MVVSNLPPECAYRQCAECQFECFWEKFLQGLKEGADRQAERERRYALGLAPLGQGERREAGVGDARQE